MISTFICAMYTHVCGAILSNIRTLLCVEKPCCVAADKNPTSYKPGRLRREPHIPRRLSVLHLFLSVNRKRTLLYDNFWFCSSSLFLCQIETMRSEMENLRAVAVEEHQQNANLREKLTEADIEVHSKVRVTW